MSKLPSSIVVNYSARTKGRKEILSFKINGKEFPWYLTEEGVQPGPARRGEMPSVTVTIPADKVEFLHDIGPSIKPKPKPWWRRLWP